MALKKVISTLDSNLNNNNFNNITSETIFSFGRFTIDTGIQNREIIDYSSELSSFVKPITLEDLSNSYTDIKSATVFEQSTSVVLNLDYCDLKTHIRYGSTSELLRVSIQNIILKYPASLFVDPQKNVGGNVTFYEYSYDVYTNKSTFKIPSQYIENKFGHVYNEGNLSKPDDNELKNLNLSFSKYVAWSTLYPNDLSHTILGFTGDSSSRNYVKVICSGNLFPNLSGNTTGRFNLHLRPISTEYDDFKLLLSPFEKYLINKRDGIKGFIVTLKDPTLLENGQILYGDNQLTWSTKDGYNIDFDGYSYTSFLQSLLNIGNKYDATKTDLIARFLTPLSIKQYDLTTEGKLTKLLRIYGREFDTVRQLIDSLVTINKVSYNKKNNLPDQLVKNLANTLGWEVFTLVDEEQFVNSVLTSNSNDNSNMLPSEIDIELWRRIIINTNYYWKSKGTRDAIKSMFLLIGIPEPFINITEYIYTVDEKINPNTVPLTLDQLPSASLPYDNEGYPVAPIETDDFYFQISGDSDNGQTYMNNFRSVGFVLNKTIDNKKSWSDDNNIYRRHDLTPQYYIKDERLILNTKEVDVSLDLSRGIEYDLQQYITLKDYPINSTGFTMPFAYVNISAGYSGSATSFIIPNDPIGDIEVAFNGITLSSPNITDGNNTTTDIGTADYYINPGNQREVILLNNSAKVEYGNQRDVVEISYIHRLFDTLVSSNVKYVVTRVTPNLTGTIIPLPETPNGDIQLTINGVALVKDQDFLLTGSQISILNSTVIAFLVTNPVVQVSYIVSTNIDIKGKSEVFKINSYNSSKFYFNNSINKYIYRLNYKITDVRNVRLLVNGIVLEPGKDYILSSTNQYELFLPSALKLGDYITAYYLIGSNSTNSLIIDDSFGLGDLSDLTFLEFLELIQRKLINARTRKIISDFRGGFYPYLYYVYASYLKRSFLDSNNPLISNGYTFANLYPFLNKYNGFFQKFVDDLLSSTIILGQSGIVTRNTIFSKQKYMYRRGVSFDPSLVWFGDVGTLYKRRLTEKSYEWTSDFVCYDAPAPSLTQVYLYNLDEEISEDNEIYLYNNDEEIPDEDQVYLYNNDENITGSTGFDTFVTKGSLVLNSLIASGNTKTLNYTLNLDPALIPLGKQLKLKLRYNSILENNNVNNFTVNSNQTAEIYINNILLETYTNQLNIGGNKNDESTTDYIILNRGDLLTGKLIVSTNITGSSTDKYSTINELNILLFEAKIEGSIVDIQNFEDELSVSINKEN